LGLSHSTVSRALRNRPEIALKTRERVLRQAEEMGYEPDPMLSALAKYRLSSGERPVKASIAWLNTWSDPTFMLTINELSLYLEGAAEMAQRFGYSLETFELAGMSLARIEGILKSRNIRGVLIAPLHDPKMKGQAADLKSFPWENFSVVRLGRATAYPPVHFVTSAQTANTMLAFERISSKGYKRVGFVGYRRPLRIFLSGFVMGQLQVPESHRLEPLLLSPEDTLSEKVGRFARWFEKEKPDAILADLQEISFILEELGIRVPDEIALATMTLHDNPVDAGIDQKPKEVGRAAARLMISLLNEQNSGLPEACNEILIRGDWIDGSMMPDRT